MRYFKTTITDFDNEMQIFKDVLEQKGYVLESDHMYAYNMQSPDAFKDVRDWLSNNGYEGELETAGAYEGVAVYGLYDSTRISLKEMQSRLLEEAKLQNSVANFD